jgi:HAMP domain-containing protein
MALATIRSTEEWTVLSVVAGLVLAAVCVWAVWRVIQAASDD